jgi:glycogen debranching enzyme
VTGLAENSGLARAKMVLNALHAEMAIQGFEEGLVNQENDVSSSSDLSKE